MSARPTAPAGLLDLTGPELDHDLGAISRRGLWRAATRRMLPGHDREPLGWAWRLSDAYGDVWRPVLDEQGRKVWTCEQCPELSLKWSAPALAAAGPFIALPTAPEQAVHRRRVD